MEKIDLQQAEEFAHEANINGVAAFLRQDEASEYDQASIEVLLESLMAAYIEQIRELDMDEHIFSNIKRIANMRR